MTQRLDKTRRPDDPDEEDGSAEAAAASALWVLYSKERGVVCEPPRLLTPGVTRIGRAVPVDELNIESDAQSSREHSALQLRSGQAPRLRDLDSSNGTFVNGARIREVELADGDIIRVGTTLMLLRVGSPPAKDATVPTLLGQSWLMQRLRQELHLIGPSLATVLLQGESGTGKEVVARALHELSGLRGPLIAVNCAAVPESLAESQLFGNTGGAFTGAQAQPGYFRSAHGGTLFLDEVGELPRSLQPKLLRVLEEGLVTPVGAVTPQPCRVRLLAATNRALRQAIAEGKMRGDLFARLAEITLQLPPLQKRREDILLLLQDALGPGAPKLAPRLAEALVLYDWPFNVRELRKVATELRVRGAGATTLSLQLVSDRLRPATPLTESAPPVAAAVTLKDDKSAEPVSVPVSAEAVEPERPMPSREALIALLGTHHGKVSAVAQALRRSRTQTYRLLAQLGVNPDDFRAR